jgi:hypothetical protein
MYLIYSNEQDAWDRSEQEGVRLRLSYHVNGKGSRYVTSPLKTNDDQWALSVDTYQLDSIESSNTVVNPVFPSPSIDDL